MGVATSSVSDTLFRTFIFVTYLQPYNRCLADFHCQFYTSFILVIICSYMFPNQLVVICIIYIFFMS